MHMSQVNVDIQYDRYTSSINVCVHVLSLDPEVSSIMRELDGRSLIGTYLYSLCVKPDISTTSTSKRSHC